MPSKQRDKISAEPNAKKGRNLLKLFVYGTLKRGYWNYDKYCQGVLDIENAATPGRLYELTTGIPMLEIPSENILASGSGDPGADASLQNGCLDQGASFRGELKIDVSEGWNWVRGEILTFDDPDARLPSIDALERFQPDGPSHYRRVLAPVLTDSGQKNVVWLYIAANPLPQSAQWLSGGVWPA